MKPTRFNYCPSNPATQGATILALPKHKVYKGAPNFVYGVFSADQILASMPPEQRKGLSAASFKQCAAAPPQLEADAAGSAAYLVCDVSSRGLCGWAGGEGGGWGGGWVVVRVVVCVVVGLGREDCVLVRCVGRIQPTLMSCADVLFFPS